MEQRREPRFQADQNVEVTILGDGESTIQARVRNVSGRGLGLTLATAIPSGAALKIAACDSIYLAEAVFCRREEEGYFVGVALEQVLSELTELGRILQKYQEEPSRAQSQYAMDERTE